MHAPISRGEPLGAATKGRSTAEGLLKHKDDAPVSRAETREPQRLVGIPIRDGLAHAAEQNRECLEWMRTKVGPVIDRSLCAALAAKPAALERNRKLAHRQAAFLRGKPP